MSRAKYLIHSKVCPKCGSKLILLKGIIECSNKLCDFFMFN